MPSREITKIVKKYKELLQNEKISISKVFLYGSYARGNAQKHSDIDVAVVLSPKQQSAFEMQVKLRRLANQVDPRIEPLAIESLDFKKNHTSIMANEVQKYGILIP